MAAPVETIPTNRRIYAVLHSNGVGSMILHLSEQPPAYDGPAAVFLWRGMLPTGGPLDIPFVSDPASSPSLKGVPGKNASALLGTITVSQAATIAIAAGARRVTVPIATSLSVKAGDPLVFCPTSALAGYAFHDVVAVSSTALSVGMTGPVLAIGTSFTVSGGLYRFT